MMLGKSKELLETNQKILSTLEAQNEKLTKLEKEVGEIKVEKTSAVEGLIADLQNVTDAYQKGVEEIKIVRKDIENELNNFKIIKSKMFSKGIEEVQNQIQEEIRKLKIDATTYTDLLEELQETVKSTEKARKEIERLHQISAKIKESDFELTQFSRQIFQADKEKLELMKKIDTLERLVAQIRKKGSHPM